MAMVDLRGRIVMVNLDPTVGHEIKKTRPCLVISPDEMNTGLKTVIVAPITSKKRDYPTRVPVVFQKREGWIVLDQLRTIDKVRIVKVFERVRKVRMEKVKEVLRAMFD